MATFRDPFPNDATASVRILGPARPHSLVVFDGNKLSIQDHPVESARFSTLMVQDRIADLTGTNLKFTAAKLLRLPGVLPPGHSGKSHVDVTLLKPQELVTPAATTWGVGGGLVVEQLGPDRVELVFRGAQQTGVVTADLPALQWWHLVQVIVSVQHWMTYLRTELDQYAEVVRTRYALMAR